jgi:hypothetical protein
MPTSTKKGFGMHNKGGKKLLASHAKRTAQHSANEERRSKDPAAAAGGNRQRRGQNLAEAQHDHQSQGQFAVDRHLDPTITAGHELRQPERHRAEHQSAQGRLDKSRHG